MRHLHRAKGRWWSCRRQVHFHTRWPQRLPIRGSIWLRRTDGSTGTTRYKETRNSTTTVLRKERLTRHGLTQGRFRMHVEYRSRGAHPNRQSQSCKRRIAMQEWWLGSVPGEFLQCVEPVLIMGSILTYTMTTIQGTQVAMGFNQWQRIAGWRRCTNRIYFKSKKNLFFCSLSKNNADFGNTNVGLYAELRREYHHTSVHNRYRPKQLKGALGNYKSCRHFNAVDHHMEWGSR